MTKIKQIQQFRGIKVVANYALKYSNKLFIFTYLCSFNKTNSTINPYFLN